MASSRSQISGHLLRSGRSGFHQILTQCMFKALLLITADTLPCSWNVSMMFSYSSWMFSAVRRLLNHLQAGIRLMSCIFSYIVPESMLSEQLFFITSYTISLIVSVLMLFADPGLTILDWNLAPCFASISSDS